MLKLFHRHSPIFYNASKSIVTSIFPDVEIEKHNFTNFNLSKMRENSDKYFMIDGITGEKFTFNDAISQVKSIASYITEKCGIERNDRVAIISRNSVDYLQILMGVIACGAIVVPINASLTPYEMSLQLNMTKPKLLFTHDSLIKGLKDEGINFLETILSVDRQGKSHAIIDDVMQHPHHCCPLGDHLNQYYKDPCINIFSSGTSGIPKAVQLSHFNMISSAKTLDLVGNTAPFSVLSSYLPYSHIYSLLISLMQTITTGSTNVVMPQFNMDLLLQNIAQYKINHLYIVPPVAIYLLNHPKVPHVDLSSVVKITAGAAPLDRQVENRIIEIFRSKNSKFVFGQGYGLSETSGVVSVMTSHNPKSVSKRGSVGEILPNYRMKITEIGNPDKELGPNEVGEILLQGTNIMMGYLDMDRDDPRNGFVGDWLSTGDVGYVDEDNFLYISDRIKELIKVKGYQVAPAELEGFLLTHPGVKDAAVIGVSHDVYGEVPRAFVVRRDESVTATSIQDYIAENLSKHKRLVGGVIFIENIPKSPSGKILRRNLRNL